jgi:hypothetical protein
MRVLVRGGSCGGQLARLSSWLWLLSAFLLCPASGRKPRKLRVSYVCYRPCGLRLQSVPIKLRAANIRCKRYGRTDMPRSKQASKRRSRKEVVPMLGAVGVSLSLAGGAAAAPVVEVPSKDTAPGPRITLSEEEISDVSLGTFFVFDKETAATPRLGVKFARCGCGRGCGGCRGCGRGCRCGGGCGGCGCGGCGCCWQWGYCRVC